MIHKSHHKMHEKSNILQNIISFIISSFIALILSLMMTIAIVTISIDTQDLAYAGFFDAIGNSFKGEIETEEFDNPTEAIYKEMFDKDKGMISLSTADLDSIDALQSWFEYQTSYICCRMTGGSNISYYFNAPNLQKSLKNSVLKLNSGGWMTNSESTGEEILDDSKKETWTTALNKYGYEFPSIYYVGEYPAPELDNSSVLSGLATPSTAVKLVITKVQNFFYKGLNAILGGLSSFFGFETKNLEADIELLSTDANSIKNIKYNLNDYTDTSENTDKAISAWLEEHWNEIENNPDLFSMKLKKSNGKDIIADNQIVKSGETVGVDISGEEIYGRIVDKLGASYLVFLNVLVNVAEDNLGIEPPTTSLERYMPYDLDSMSEESRKFMRNIKDPRVEMFTGGDADGENTLYYTNTMMKACSYELISRTILAPTAWLCEVSGDINAICNLDVFSDETGYDYFSMWEGSPKELAFLIIMIAMLIVLVRGAIGSVIGNNKAGIAPMRAIGIALCLILAAAVISQPKAFGEFIEDSATKIISFGDNILAIDESYSKYYVESASQADKSKLRYWMLYFNAWCSYSTGHPYNDEASEFNPLQTDGISEGYTDETSGASITSISSQRNEYKNFYTSNATLSDGSSIESWPAVLLESEFKSSRDMYRVTDHYMAPVIANAGYPLFTVNENPFYNGVYMCSKAPFAQELIALATLIITFLKFLCFIELIIDIILLLLRIAWSALSGMSEIKETLLGIGKDVMKILVYEIILVVVIELSFILSSTSSLGGLFSGAIVLGLVIALTIYIFKHPEFILAPTLINMTRNTVNRVVDSTSSFVKGNKSINNASTSGGGSVAVKREDLKSKLKNTASSLKRG